MWYNSLELKTELWCPPSFPELMGLSYYYTATLSSVRNMGKKRFARPPYLSVQAHSCLATGLCNRERLRVQEGLGGGRSSEL